MTATVDLSSIESADVLSELHHMPCKIQHDSKAKVSQYFNPSISTNEGLTASFRGRPLDGCVISVPHDYLGVVLCEPHRPFDEEEEREVKIKGTFESYTHWNLNKPPSDNDSIVKALQWINLSKAIHAPVSEESSQTSVTGK